MPFETPPHESTARSASTHSTTVLARIEAQSPGAMPSDSRPSPISRTAWAVCAQVHSRHRPSFFSRIRTRAERAATPFQNSAGIVSPARTTSSPACSLSVSQRFIVRRFRSSPGLLPLPAPLAARAGFLHAEIELLDVVLLAQPRAGVLHDDAAVLEDVAVVGDVERHVGVLLDQQQRRAAVAVDAHDDLEDLARQPRREAEARLVEQDHLRRRHQGARDAEHLLLPAREQPGFLVRALAQDREVAVDHLHVARRRVAIAARVGAHQQVVAHRQQREHLAPFRHVAEAAADDVGGVHRRDVGAGELDAALPRVDDPGDRLQDRRLAGTVGTEHRADAALLDREADAADGANRPVRGLDVEELEDAHRATSAATRRSDDTSSAAPRYASTTPGWRCTSAGVPSASIWPWFMASTRSETFETRVMSCSTISTVMPSSARMSSIQNAMSSLSSTFRPDDGSSRRISFGSVQSARASSTTLRTPYGSPATRDSR